MESIIDLDYCLTVAVNLSYIKENKYTQLTFKKIIKIAKNK